MKFQTIKFFVLLITCTLAIIIGTIASYAVTPQKTDTQIVKSYCAKHYKGYKIKYFTKWNEKTILNRKGKKVVYVEKMVSYSRGNYGYTKEGYYIKYNKRVAKNKKVISYCIYNPKTNYCDDVVAVIDNRKIR